MLASIFNLTFPGMGLGLYGRTVQGLLYFTACGLLAGLHDEIGAIWWVYLIVMAQIHFSRVKKGTVSFSARGKRILWTVTVLLVALFSLSYGYSLMFGHALRDRIRFPLAVFIVVNACLMVPVLLETFWLKPRTTRQVFESRRAWRKLPSQFLDALANKLKSEKNATEFARLCEKTGIFKNNIMVLADGDPKFAIGGIAVTLTSYANALGDRRQFGEAKRGLELALLLNPRHVPAWATMALVSFYLEDFGAAAYWADKMLSFEPDSNSNDLCERVMAESLTSDGEQFASEALGEPQLIGNEIEVRQQMQAIKEACRHHLTELPTIAA